MTLFRLSSLKGNFFFSVDLLFTIFSCELLSDLEVFLADLTGTY